MLHFRGLVAAALMLWALPLAAQPGSGGSGGTGQTGGDRVILDGVAAVVGSDVILISDVLQRAQMAAQQDRSVDARSPDFQRQVLNSLIEEKLVLTRAREDSIVVRDEEVTEAVNRRLQQITQQMGGESAVERAYGMPMQRIRQEARDVIYQQLLQQRLVQRHFSDLKVTDRDVQEFYNAYRDSLPTVPEQIEIQQILLRVRPSAASKDATRTLAQTIVDSLRAGGDFSSFAHRYSADPVSAKEGGDLGWVAPGVFVKEFEHAARRLGVNDISDPVESEYGYHIIQLLDRKPDGSFHARHILLQIQQPQAERDSLMALLRDIRSRALAGESFEDLARKYSEDEVSAAAGGVIGRVAVDQLPADLKTMLGTMKEGEITEPATVAVSQVENGFRILRVSKRIPPHRLDVKEDRPLLEKQALTWKQNREYEKWIADLRKEIYWDIKTNF